MFFPKKTRVFPDNTLEYRNRLFLILRKKHCVRLGWLLLESETIQSKNPHSLIEIHDTTLSVTSTFLSSKLIPC